jgi:hypothetical protein
MRDFKFFSVVNENNLLEPARFNELVEYIRTTPIDFIPTEPPQIHTQMLRMNIPINEMTEDRLNHLKISQERRMLEELSDTLDFRHEVIHQDEFGFTLRSELYL